MKRVLVAAMMLLVTGSVFATDVNVDREKGKQEVKASEVKKEGLDKQCTVTLKGKLSYFLIADVEYSCSATAETCKEATDDAMGCVDYNISIFKKKIDNLRNWLLSFFD